MLYSYKSVYANFQLQQCYSKEKGTGTHMEQNNISEQENDLQMNEKKGNKKTDEKAEVQSAVIRQSASLPLLLKSFCAL